jgi:hypothetical protein
MRRRRGGRGRFGCPCALGCRRPDPGTAARRRAGNGGRTRCGRRARCCGGRRGSSRGRRVSRHVGSGRRSSSRSTNTSLSLAFEDRQSAAAPAPAAALRLASDAEPARAAGGRAAVLGALPDLLLLGEPGQVVRPPLALVRRIRVVLVLKPGKVGRRGREEDATPAAGLRPLLERDVQVRPTLLAEVLYKERERAPSSATAMSRGKRVRSRTTHRQASPPRSGCRHSCRAARRCTCRTGSSCRRTLQVAERRGSSQLAVDSGRVARARGRGRGVGRRAPSRGRRQAEGEQDWEATRGGGRTGDTADAACDFCLLCRA